VLSEVSGPLKDIMDVERFGDRLDVLAHDPDKAGQIVEELCSKAGLHISDVRVDGPTLENVFVAGLRALGEESKIHRSQVTTTTRTCTVKLRSERTI